MVYGDYKGIPKEQIRRALDSGHDVMLRLDVQGAATVRKLCPQAIFIFLAPPSLEELEQRLRARLTETPDSLARRMTMAPPRAGGDGQLRLHGHQPPRLPGDRRGADQGHHHRRALPGSPPLRHHLAAVPRRRCPAGRPRHTPAPAHIRARARRRIACSPNCAASPFSATFPKRTSKRSASSFSFGPFEKDEVIFAEGDPRRRPLPHRVRPGAGGLRRRGPAAGAGHPGRRRFLRRDGPAHRRAPLGRRGRGAGHRRLGPAQRPISTASSQTHPSIAITLARVLSRRLSQVDRQLTATPRPEAGERLRGGRRRPGARAGPQPGPADRRARPPLQSARPAPAAAQWTDWLEAVHPRAATTRWSARATCGRATWPTRSAP